MDYDTALEYSSAIEVIEAQEALVSMKISSYPHVKDNDRKDIHKAYHRIAFKHVPKKEMTSENLEEMLKLKGFL